ncbi:MAG: hypothetical protein HKN49_03915, partial [Gammaproteobacteria bacterium]|nr:hypothetical protein [Gammaproteobacteria bacterium]
MSRVRIKICGLTRRDELEAVCAAGIDAVGFVLSPSPRQLDPGSAMTLMQHLPPWVASVVVTRHPPADFGATVLSQLVPDWWQSDAGDFDGQQVPSGTRLLPVLRENEQQATTPPFYVYEGAQSGRGQTVDWQRAARQAGHGQMILAGGLDPD